MNGWPRRRRRQRYDIVTPTADERRMRDISKRRGRYFMIMIPCLVLAAFGFFSPAPVPIRIGALAVAAVLPPIAAIVGNAWPR